jgi:hypothetical protein
VYGIPGDSLNGSTDALRRDGGIITPHAARTILSGKGGEPVDLARANLRDLHIE